MRIYLKQGEHRLLIDGYLLLSWSPSLLSLVILLVPLMATHETLPCTVRCSYTQPALFYELLLAAPW